MKLTTGLAIAGAFGWLMAACKQPAPDALRPAAADSVRVVTTFVSGSALTIGTRRSSIQGMTFDAAGNLYVVDANTYRVRKISPMGVVTTVAGSGERGYQDGPGPVAKFDGLQSIVIDKTGDLLVGEGFDNNCIRRIKPDGTVSTVAGKPYYLPTLTPGFDGPNTLARFIVPVGLAVDASNNLYISDIGSVNRDATDAIRRITPDGYVRTIAGYVPGVLFQGRITNNSPQPWRFLCIAVNSQGNVVGVDYANRLLYQISPTGDMSTFANLRLTGMPSAMTYGPEGTLYVANQSKIWQVTPSGQSSVLTGADQVGFKNDSLSKARFNGITALACDQQGTLYISDQSSGDIRRVRFK